MVASMCWYYGVPALQCTAALILRHVRPPLFPWNRQFLLFPGFLLCSLPAYKAGSIYAINHPKTTQLLRYHHDIHRTAHGTYPMHPKRLEQPSRFFDMQLDPHLTITNPGFQFQELLKLSMGLAGPGQLQPGALTPTLADCSPFPLLFPFPFPSPFPRALRPITTCRPA